MSIRNLRDAPSFGSTVSLDIRDFGRSSISSSNGSSLHGSQGRKRHSSIVQSLSHLSPGILQNNSDGELSSSFSSNFNNSGASEGGERGGLNKLLSVHHGLGYRYGGASHHHHMAGDVMGPSSLSSFPYVSYRSKQQQQQQHQQQQIRRNSSSSLNDSSSPKNALPSSSSVASSFTAPASAAVSTLSSLLPQSPTSPLPRRFRKLRSATWDSASLMGLGRLSPLGRVSEDGSGFSANSGDNLPREDARLHHPRGHESPTNVISKFDLGVHVQRQLHQQLQQQIREKNGFEPMAENSLEDASSDDSQQPFFQNEIREEDSDAVSISSFESEEEKHSSPPKPHPLTIDTTCNDANDLLPESATEDNEDQSKHPTPTDDSKQWSASNNAAAGSLKRGVTFSNSIRQLHFSSDSLNDAAQQTDNDHLDKDDPMNPHTTIHIPDRRPIRIRSNYIIAEIINNTNSSELEDGAYNDDEDDYSSAPSSPISSPNHYARRKGFSLYEESNLRASSRALKRQRSQQQLQQRRTNSKNPFRNFSWSLIGAYIVRTAPCFWCMNKLGTSTTDREIVMRLNMLCSIFCLVQIGLGLFLLTTSLSGIIEDEREYSQERDMYGEDGDMPQESKVLLSPDLWNLFSNVYMLSFVNFVLLIASVLAQRVIREVNLVGTVRFMWSLFWLLPIQILFMISLFDYYRVMEVWIKHWWDTSSMTFYRKLFCQVGTANEECMVPVMGGAGYETEDEWCLAKYNATNCSEIRNIAQDRCTVASYIFFTSNGVWSLVLVALMWVTLHVLQAIITMPIVQRSKESNIPLWLTLPIVGCFGAGALLLYSPSAIKIDNFSDLYYMGLVYMVSGGTFTLAALVGYFLKYYSVLNGREKKCKQGVVLFFIGTIIATILSVSGIFTVSMIYSLNLLDMSLEEYRLIACFLDSAGSCTGCNNDRSSYSNGEEVLVCPEWSEDDVQRILETIMKTSATFAAIFLVYAFITLRYGFVLFRHVSKYQIEYV